MNVIHDQQGISQFYLNQPYSDRRFIHPYLNNQPVFVNKFGNNIIQYQKPEIINRPHFIYEQNGQLKNQR